MNGAMPTAAFGLAIRRVLLAIAYEVIAKRCSLLRYMSPFMGTKQTWPDVRLESCVYRKPYRC
jgi:hypothetical protein